MKVGDIVILKNWHKAIILNIDSSGIQTRNGNNEIHIVQEADILRVETAEDRRGECS